MRKSARLRHVATTIFAASLASSCGTYADEGYKKSWNGVVFNTLSNPSTFGYSQVISTPLPGADASTFVTMSGSMHHARDKAQVYFDSRVIKGANPATFRLLPVTPYSADGVSIFYEAQKLEGANPATV